MVAVNTAAAMVSHPAESYAGAAAAHPGRSAQDNDGFVAVERRKKSSTPSAAVPRATVQTTASNMSQSQSVGDKKRKWQIFGNNAVSADAVVKPGRKLLRKTVLHVDNLSAECTADNLKDFLESANIKVYTCFTAKSWLRSKDKEQSKPVDVSAFRVCIDRSSKNDFFTPSLWPECVIIREWKFKKSEDGAAV